MTVTTVRPSSTVSNGGGQWSTSPSGTHDAVQADALDTTMSMVGTGSGGAALVMELGDIAAPAANQRIAQVRFRVRASMPAGKTVADLRVRGYDPTTAHYTAEDRWTSFYSNAPAWNDLVGAWRTTDPNGVEWSSAVVNRIRESLADYTPFDAGFAASVAASYFDVDVRTQGAATVTGPTGTVTTTSQPTVTTTYSDPDSQAPTLMSIRVFTQAVYSAGGFDPATAVAAWEYQGSYVASKQVAVPLVNATTYRAYVIIAKDFNGQAWYSPWAFSTFTISVTPPTAPTIALTFNATTHAYSLAVSTSAPPVGATAYAATLYRRVGSIDGGGFAGSETYDVIYTTALPLAAGSPAFTYIDRTAPRNRSVVYRATVTATVTGSAVTSGNTDTATQFVAPDKRWLLKTVSAADGSGTDWIDAMVREAPSVSVTESQGVFRPLGRRNAVVVTSAVHGEDGGYVVTVRGAAVWAVALAVLRSTDPVWVSDPFGGNKFVRFTGREWELLGTFASPRRPVTVSYVEVDDPRAVT